MSPEKGLLEQYIENKISEGNSEGGVKPASKPEVLFTRKKDIVSRLLNSLTTVICVW